MIADRVARGVALLDKHDPEWREGVRHWVDMADPELCILGQLFGRYSVGVAQVVPEYALAADYGFDVTDDHSYADLRDAWLGVIR